MNMKAQRSTLLLVAALIVLVLALTGCDRGSGGAGASGADAARGEFPLDTDVTLRYWKDLNWNTASNFANYGDTPFAQAWQEATGVNVEFIHGAADDAFTLLFVAGDLPDIIQFWWTAYPGEHLGALTDEVVVPLNDLWDYAPLYRDWLDRHPDIARAVVLPGGYYFGFPSVIGDGSEINISQGAIIRQDLLDELGLDIPETIDEWTYALLAIRDSGLAEIPLTIGWRDTTFIRAFGMSREWFVYDGEVRFGMFEPQFRQYLETMHLWFSEGLIDRDFVTVDQTATRARMFDGTAAATVDWWSGVAAMAQNGPENIEGFNAWPAPLPMLTHNDRYNQFSDAGNPHTPALVYTVVTSHSRHPEIAARFMDFLWGEEGITMANFGIEGVTFNFDSDGRRVYTDYVLNHPQGWGTQEVRGAYMLSFAAGPYVQLAEVATATFTFPQQFAAREVWSRDATLEHVLPPVQRTQEQSAEFSNIMTAVNTYADENNIAFILGTRSLEEFDIYLENLRSMGIERAIEIQNEALEAFNAR
ncbi:MAG: extracellular solute-binding protein [Defluviitaleaceae bacterium]|nr:extracellular solute-binding protein [Defluviitaleaceae bacterium]